MSVLQDLIIFETFCECISESSPGGIFTPIKWQLTFILWGSWDMKFGRLECWTGPVEFQQFPLFFFLLKQKLVPTKIMFTYQTVMTLVSIRQWLLSRNADTAIYQWLGGPAISLFSSSSFLKQNWFSLGRSAHLYAGQARYLQLLSQHWTHTRRRRMKLICTDWNIPRERDNLIVHILR